MENLEKKKYELALIIQRNLKAAFIGIHFSGNLMNTIKLYKTERGYAVEIPAQIYDIAMYKSRRVIIPTGRGSYAQQVNQDGGFSGAHKGYVESVINDSIKEWLNINQIKAKVTNV